MDPADDSYIPPEQKARQRIVGQLTENAEAFFSGKALRVVS